MLAFQVAGMLGFMTSLCSLYTASAPWITPAVDTVVSPRCRTAHVKRE